jgi:hypothetical protein
MFGPIDSTNAMLLIGALDDQVLANISCLEMGPKLRFSNKLQYIIYVWPKYDQPKKAY